ncbi:hypothetical protein SAMN05444287_0996 [Octadecabacter temperatus]|uniref:Uncharacterized protein n=1 Tax=Octadecabacter temperatus TaxID=1458307 RepID=A0A0K0Y4H1_9RHOB|nr:hypothetical protein [Octadecabacter temperatus]AKS45893.1 hypothetical protein OSB_13400 [Octadecabacter temperatus]SIO02931.1 hypothetical protein SAMN05444287_0996 [Octadecabacter temperatus]
MRNLPSTACVVLSAFLASPALADDGCDDIRKLMPEDFNDFALVSCETEGTPQTRAQLTLTVPPEDVIALSKRLTADFGMGELVFLCCGYEPAGGQNGSFEVPEGIIAPGPSGSYTHLSIGMSAMGLDETGSGGATEFFSLGETTATLSLAIVDI